MAVAYGLGSTPSTPVQLNMPMSLLRTRKGSEVQLIAEILLWRLKLEYLSSKIELRNLKETLNFWFSLVSKVVVRTRDPNVQTTSKSSIPVLRVPGQNQWEGIWLTYFWWNIILKISMANLRIQRGMMVPPWRGLGVQRASAAHSTCDDWIHILQNVFFMNLPHVSV